MTVDTVTLPDTDAKQADVGLWLPATEMLVPDGVTVATFDIDRALMLDGLDAQCLEFAIDVSLDGGRTWGGTYVPKVADGFKPSKQYSLFMQCGTTGKSHGLSGQPENSRFSLELPDFTGRMIRGRYRCKKPLKFGSVFVFDDRPVAPVTEEAIHHSVSYDAGSACTAYDNVSTVSWNHATTSADLVVCHAARITTFTEKTMTVAFGTSSGTGGTAMTEISGAFASANDATFFAKSSLYFLTAASVSITGTQEVTITFTSGAAYGGSGASTWLGADQTTPLDGRQIDAAASGANPSVTVTSATGNAVIDAFAYNGGKAFTVTTQTAIFEVGPTSQTGSGSRASGAASVAMGYTSITAVRALIGANIAAAAAGGASPPKGMYYRQMIGGPLGP